MSEKIQPTHLERPAYVYVRQSTAHQVRNHQESQTRQYGLRDRAKALGFQSVEVIDEDLGRSGSGSDQRPGFDRLVGTVCGGQAGAVLAIEASRLARNNRDWHHLIDLCAMTETLVIDHDGVYDPSQLNDRLLLGLKGTMSEFELNLWRQRAQEALNQMIERGEVLFCPPVGYVRTEDNHIEMSPDRQVQAAIRGVFEKFTELGSARQVLLWYRHNGLRLPSLVSVRGQSQVRWQLPVYNRVHAILTNPMYAGAFVYGRRGTRTKVVEGRARKTAGHALPRDQWRVIIHDHHEAYIDWETFLANQRQLESNLAHHHRGGRRNGAAKSGSALLAGLLRCARCGRKLHVCYSGMNGRVPRYSCRGAHINHGEGSCISFGGLRPDQRVAETVIEALQPMGVEASLEAWQQHQNQTDEKLQSLQLAKEKAQYEADRVRRQYEAVEPENRLVAAELEQRWEQALAEVQDLQNRLAAVDQQKTSITDEERQQLMALGEDLHTLWQHPNASADLKKRILRTVLHEIIVDVTDEPPEIRMTLHWAGGVHTPLIMPRNRTGQHKRRTDQQVVELVRQLAEVCSDARIAGQLNRLGYQTGAGHRWTEPRVRSLRNRHKIPAYDPEAARDRLTLHSAAKGLGVSATVVRRLVHDGTLPAKRPAPGTQWIIERADLQREAVQAAVKAAQRGERRPHFGVDESQVLLFQQRSEV